MTFRDLVKDRRLSRYKPHPSCEPRPKCAPLHDQITTAIGNLNLYERLGIPRKSVLEFWRDGLSVEQVAARAREMAVQKLRHDPNAKFSIG